MTSNFPTMPAPPISSADLAQEWETLLVLHHGPTKMQDKLGSCKVDENCDTLSYTR